MEEEKIKNFVNDKAMTQAVYNALLNSFLSEKETSDVHVLAASRLAINYLKEGFNHLERFKEVKDTTKKEGNVGL